MSDQATQTALDRSASQADAQQAAYEPNWYASLLAFSHTVEDVDEPRVVE
jgi:hypothetical protein